MNAVAVEPVAVALLHGTWFVPAVEVVAARGLAPAERCAVRELGWLAWTATVVTAPLREPATDLLGWIPLPILLFGLLPGLGVLATWGASAWSLGRRRTVSWPGRAPIELGDVPAPLAWGVWRPRIVLPLAAIDWPEARVDAVIAHERAHVARADFLRRALALALGPAVGAHPLFWWSMRRHARDVEEAADARALQAGIGVRTYAQALLDLGAAGPVPAAALSGQSHLASRIEAVLRPARSSRWARLAAATLIVGLLASPLVVPAAEAPPPPPPGCA